MKTIHVRDLVLWIGLEKVFCQLPFSNIAKRPHVIMDVIDGSGRMAMMQVSEDDIRYLVLYKEIVKSLTT
jgi:hypothetical protein